MVRLLERHPVLLAYLVTAVTAVAPVLIFRSSLGLEVAFLWIEVAALPPLLLMLNATVRRGIVGALATAPILLLGAPLYAMWVLNTNCAIRTNCL